MSSKKNKKSTISTASKINWMYVGRLLTIFIMLNLIIVMGTIIAYTYAGCRAAGVDYNMLHPLRNVSFAIDSNNGALSYNTGGPDRTAVLELDYKDSKLWWYVSDESVSGEVHKMLERPDYASDLTIVMNTVQIALIIVVCAEIFFIIWNILFGIFSIRRKLKPLDDMARMTHELGSRDNYEGKVDELKDAITKLSPGTTAAGEVELHTNDKDLKDLETAINGLLARMREAYRQQGRFVSDASHELRTPIAVIQGYVNMLDRWGKSDEKILDESIEAIKNESDHMKRLVDQLLFLARGDSGRNKFVLEKVKLNDIVNEVYEESLMIDENHIYRCDCATEVDIIADLAMLKQSIRILVDNASKYTPDKEQIRIGCGYDDNMRPFFYVQDNGVGMGQSELSHVFERFYRADDARESKTGGTGLGLAIARWIVERHGGFFKLLSRKDIGTRITVVLPQEEVKSEYANTFDGNVK